MIIVFADIFQIIPITRLNRLHRKPLTALRLWYAVNECSILSSSLINGCIQSLNNSNFIPMDSKKFGFRNP